eukprot:357412-Chlamydomonas_euryale.AAC.4
MLCGFVGSSLQTKPSAQGKIRETMWLERKERERNCVLERDFARRRRGFERREFQPNGQLANAGEARELLSVVRDMIMSSSQLRHMERVEEGREAMGGRKWVGTSLTSYQGSTVRTRVLSS